MGMLKHYLLTVLERCSDEAFGQEAVEHAITTGAVQLTGVLDADLRAILAQYDQHCHAYREACRAHEHALIAA